ncbi:LysM peptidoglycan-binding domain-containing protein [Caminibacter pacificus]
MKKLFLIFFVFLILRADVVNDSNINVLDALNIEDSFLLNPTLQKQYKEYAYRKKRYFLNILENGYDILPIIRKRIQKSNIPPELIAVAMAESYFMLDAKSDKRARGLWQFMPKTAKRFGLRIDSYVDERLDPIKSTQAAIDYLKYLHDYFGKWYLAILAYNAGEARVVEAVVRAKVDKLCNIEGEKCQNDPDIKKYRKIIKEYQQKGSRAYLPLYKLYKKLSHIHITLDDLLRYQPGLKRQYLPKETRKYIIKILAMSFLFNNDEFLKYSNSYILNSGVTPSFDRVTVPGGTSLFYVARLLHMSYKELREHNLHLKNSFTPPYKYYIYIPYKKIAYFKKHFNYKKRYIYTYKVKKGDSLLKIAKKFGISIRILRDYNRFGRYLRVGQKIVVPLNSRFIKYKVRNGDSLAGIARRFGISYKKIMRLNDMKSTVIRVGQILKIPQRY